MKKLFLGLLIASTLFSCKKDDNSNSNTTVAKSIKFKFDGSNYEYSSGLSCTKDSLNGGVVVRYLNMNASSSTNSIKFTIQKHSGTSIFTGTYTLDLNPTLPSTYPEIILNINGQKFSSSPGGITQTVTSSFIVSVNSDDNKTIAGTFTGDIYPISNTGAWTGGTKKTITEGTFNLSVN